MPSRLTGTARDARSLSGTCTYVGPHSRYANPFRVGDREPSLLGTPMDAGMAVNLFTATLRGPVGRQYAVRFARALHDLDLMCTCPPGAPCHADVLLRLANSPSTSGLALRTTRPLEGPR
ncbi:DUF4326 domain-containing protein [Streptomyces sp. 891-h]|uniref:DUF4326 domain-containing protein n=1 Tax=Streptomyces sp. 891-h TaxID=2720714 RepID=UPI001FAA52CD|nr:DUF4326 domain-containing protein [Streptomyces sp. 891-h]UNZ18172.1 DUF4326 domain-containing protein [Streptomyces sp. 891-h]